MARERSHAPAGDLPARVVPGRDAVTFVVNGALGGFAFVFIPALEIIAGFSPVEAGWRWCRSPS